MSGILERIELKLDDILMALSAHGIDVPGKVSIHTGEPPSLAKEFVAPAEDPNPPLRESVDIHSRVDKTKSYTRDEAAKALIDFVGKNGRDAGLKLLQMIKSDARKLDDLKDIPDAWGQVVARIAQGS